MFLSLSLSLSLSLWFSVFFTPADDPFHYLYVLSLPGTHMLPQVRTKRTLHDTNGFQHRRSLQCRVVTHSGVQCRSVCDTLGRTAMEFFLCVSFYVLIVHPRFILGKLCFYCHSVLRERVITRARARTHARTHTHTRARAHTQTQSVHAAVIPGI